MPASLGYIAEGFPYPLFDSEDGPVYQLFIYSRNQLTNYQIGLVRPLVSRFVVQPSGALKQIEALRTSLNAQKLTMNTAISVANL